MHNALEKVLGGEYTVVIEEELKKLKQSDRLLLGEPCAVLYRTDANLGRPVNECENEDKYCYIVFLPSKYGIVCNKNFESFKSADGKVKLVSLSYFIERLLEFNFTFLQLVEDKAVVWQSDAFSSIIKEYKKAVDEKDYLLELRYKTLVSIAMSLYSDIKAGKIKNEEACKNRLFMLYVVCETCNSIASTGKYSISNIFNENIYNVVKSEYTEDNGMELLKQYIEKIKNCELNVTKRDKDVDRCHRLQVKYKLVHDVTMSVLNSEEV